MRAQRLCFARFAVGATLSALLVAAAADVAAQSVRDAHGEVSAPDLKPGDGWVYNKIDGWTGNLQFVVVDTIKQVSPSGMVIEAVVPGSTTTTRMERDREVNLFRTEAPDSVQTVSPSYPSYAFPLTVGKRWTRKVTFANSAQPDKEVTAWFEAKVIGWEMVTVPAGTFDALRIELTANYRASNSQGSWNGTMVDRLWYAPEVRNAVKYEYLDTMGGSKYTHERFELVRYWRAP